jgi:hypothetical protein
LKTGDEGFEIPPLFLLFVHLHQNVGQANQSIWMLEDFTLNVIAHQINKGK